MEILFRGKRLDNGEWVYGHLYTQVYHPDTIEEEWYWFIKPIGSESWVSYRVDTSTVGQYAGLNDKNDKRIFENGYMIIDKQTYKVLFDNGEYILKNIFNCDIIQLRNNSNIGVFVDEI